MTGMEAAIRGALEKAGIPGAQARRRIYDSARGALDRSLERQGIIDADKIAEHRHKLEQLIADIEAEWTPPGETDAPGFASAGLPSQEWPDAPAATTAHAEPAPVIPAPGASGRTGSASPIDPAWSGSAAASPHAGSGAAPVVAPASRASRPPEALRSEASLDIAPDASDHTGPSGFAGDAGPGAEPSPHIPAPAGTQARPDRPEKKIKVPKQRHKPRKEKRRRGVFAGFFSAAVMLSFLGIGIWWMADSGLFKSAAERDTGVPNPPPSLSRDDFAGGPQPLNPGAGFSSDWTNVYTPGRDGAPQPGGDASAEIIEEQDSTVLRIVSRSGGAGGEVRVPLSAQVMQALAGRQSVLALTVRTAAPEPTQIYVACEFSVLGDCGRHRFNVTYDTTDILFDLNYDRALAPNEGGHLVINSDISGGGKGIDLVAVRMRPAS
ncbi:hypothetical protein [Hoeflea sp.]|uniref:hypothetical protein n=1 Tax=Hoeflea sp. TaxID=1940281 RepID=UPI0019BE6159|nr:hypothetical protein [Hoeflea sp.]MBC7281872.1 hypothetical protein [Hoeflea sp.]